MIHSVHLSGRVWEWGPPASHWDNVLKNDSPRHYLGLTLVEATLELCFNHSKRKFAMVKWVLQCDLLFSLYHSKCKSSLLRW